MAKKTKKGSVLVYALGVIAFVSIILLGLVQLITSQARFAYDTVDREKAFEIVESCSHEYRWYLAHNTDGKTIEQVQEFWEGNSPMPRGLVMPYEWDLVTSSGFPIGKCSAKITNATVNANTPINVEFKGYGIKNPDIERKLKVRFKRTSWSDYVVLTNEYAYFDPNWDIKGRIMSNTGVHFDGVAHGRVYAGSSSYYDPVLGATESGVWSSQPLPSDPLLPKCEYNQEKSSCVFLGGKKFPVPQKDFQGIAVDLNAMKNSAQYPSGTTVDSCHKESERENCYFSVPVGKVGKHITLRTDGKFEIITVKDVKSNSNDIRSEDAASKGVYDIPQNGIIFVGGNVWVEGKIDDRRVTIVAGEGNGDIYVGNGDLKYTNKDGKDAIGLIAKGNILLTGEKKTCNGPCTTDQDLELDAAMVAKDGKIGKEDFNPNCCGSGCEKQKNRIDIFGSVVSNKFIEFTASKECNGNSDTKVGFQIKSIEYDNYLYMDPPPYFPSDVYYTVDLWEEIK